MFWRLCLGRRVGLCRGDGRGRASPEGADLPVMSQLHDGLVVAFSLCLFACICFLITI